MKIAYLFGSLNRGGTETLMLDVCKNLKKTDFEAIGIYRKSGVLENEFTSTDIPFYRLPSPKNKLKYLFRLRKLILSENITIAHAQQPIDSVYAKLACIGTGIKVVLTFHGFDYNIDRRLLKFIIKKTDRNIFVSHYQKGYYTDKYQLDDKKQTVLYNGIDFEKLNVKKTPSSLRKELNLPENKILLGMVGNFNIGRNPLSVCKFLKLLSEKCIDFHFIFVGKRVENMPQKYDECVNFCKTNQLSDQVSFLGTRNDVPALLPQLDAFIYATDHDTFGIAVVEAMAVGIPVFVNDWAVMNEVTENGKLATLYKTNDETDLIEKFMVFLQHKEERTQTAQNISTHVREKYYIKRHIENLNNLYDQLTRINSHIDA